MDEASRARNELLRRAYGIICDYGWIQRDYGDPEMGFCPVGALAEAREELRDQARYDSESLQSGYYSALDALQELAVLRKRVALEGIKPVHGYVRIADWNDAPGRTRGEVLDMLAQAQR